MKSKLVKRNSIILIAAFLVIAPVLCCCLVHDADASAGTLSFNGAASADGMEDCPMHKAQDPSSSDTRECDCGGSPAMMNPSFHAVTLKSALSPNQLSENLFLHASTITAALSGRMAAADSFFYPRFSNSSAGSVPLYLQNSVLRL